MEEDVCESLGWQSFAGDWSSLLISSTIEFSGIGATASVSGAAIRRGGKLVTPDPALDVRSIGIGTVTTQRTVDELLDTEPNHSRQSGPVSEERSMRTSIVGAG